MASEELLIPFIPGSDASNTAPDTGHVYGLYLQPKTWSEANAIALSLGSYLAKIETTLENEGLGSTTYNFLVSDGTWTLLEQTTPSDGGGAAYIWLGGSDASKEGE